MVLTVTVGSPAACGLLKDTNKLNNRRDRIGNRVYY